jgi:hypothetical protein
MKALALAVALVATAGGPAAHAQTSPPPASTAPAAAPPASSGPGNSAVNQPNTNNPGAPVAGANSFTEGQAKSRIESYGYSGVTALKKDDNGVWRGTAVKDGRSVSVSLDFQGNVAAQ